jgi:hypothetical protein
VPDFLHERHAGAAISPQQHHAKDPPPGAENLERPGTGELKQQVADEKDADRIAVAFGRQSQIGIHAAARQS